MAAPRILTVCTANVCRSPVAERLLARHLGGAGWSDVVVRSAGTFGGRLPVHRDTLDAAATLGIDLADHVSRRLTAELIAQDGADLVIAMSREHLRHVVAMDRTAWPRTFTLKELVRRGTGAGPMRGDDLAAWLEIVGADRRAADLLRPDEDDDVLDPYGGPARGHSAMVAEIDELGARLARLVAGS